MIHLCHQMVVQFSDKCVDCEKLCGVKQKDLDVFFNKFNSLSKDEIAVAMLVSGRDIMSLLSHMVPCVGCRKRYTAQNNHCYMSLYAVFHSTNSCIIVYHGIL